MIDICASVVAMTDVFVHAHALQYTKPCDSWPLRSGAWLGEGRGGTPRARASLRTTRTSWDRERCTHGAQSPQTETTARTTRALQRARPTQAPAPGQADSNKRTAFHSCWWHSCSQQPGEKQFGCSAAFWATAMRRVRPRRTKMLVHSHQCSSVHAQPWGYSPRVESR